ncbi:unnamed protein product [Rotaria socialis]|uniref:Uncharacterized protein n=1 Tax=Rotaria socialis TaxID=392032 RepID=A0A821PQQ7_9BILA|nr:unnamed protein product [Rotaria socialis]CAF4810778.1 unnamed protein product [Rotaria socialis]
MCISIKHISSNCHAYCPISIGYWTIKSSAKVDIVVIPEEFRQIRKLDNFVQFPVQLDICRNSSGVGQCRNSDVQIPLNPYRNKVKRQSLASSIRST